MRTGTVNPRTSPPKAARNTAQRRRWHAVDANKPTHQTGDKVKQRTRTLLKRASLVIATSLACTAMAQTDSEYPKLRPIQLVVPFPAGSVTDAQIRAIAPEASKRLGQQIVIVNRPGATGTLGPASVAKTAAPDGYTLSVVPSSLVGLPHMQKVSYDALKDFSYVIGLTGYSFGLIVRKDSPIKTLSDYIAHAKAKPGTITFASSGIGGGTHLAMAQFEQCQDVKLSHVTFKGGADATVALLGGHIDSQADGAWGAQVDNGHGRLLLLLTPNRPAQFASTPTLKELCPGVQVDAQVIGIAGPAGMPAPVVQKIHDAFKDAMGTEGFQRSLSNAKQVPIYLSTTDYTQYMTTTFGAKAQLVKSMGLGAQ
jgi:tripartite-type tricarboxylate transporter receptor subunit TctC